jgi:hypothetical protein
MADPIWISGTIAQFIHDDQIAAHGGAYGLRNAGMLESALGRPQNLYAYEQADLFSLADAAVLTERTKVAVIDALVSLLDTSPTHDYYNYDCPALDALGKIGTESALISLLEDVEFFIREAAVKGIVEIGAVDIIQTLLSLASDPELVTTLIWHLELMRKDNIKIPALDLLLADRELAGNLLNVAEKTIVDTAIREANNSGGLVFCLGAIGSTNEAVLVLDKLIKAGYHHFHYVLRSLARIDNQLAIDKLSEYLFADSEKANHMGGELRQVYKLGIVPHLWKCERNHYSGSVFDIIETIQEREGFYNPDFSDRSHPLFEPYTARLRYFLLGDTSI